jgi:hypothetical protein
LKVSIKAILAHLPLLRMSHRGGGLTQKYAGAEPPLRSELFSTEQMSSMAGPWQPRTRWVLDTLRTNF